MRNHFFHSPVRMKCVSNYHGKLILTQKKDFGFIFAPWSFFVFRFCFFHGPTSGCSAKLHFIQLKFHFKPVPAIDDFFYILAIIPLFFLPYPAISGRFKLNRCSLKSERNIIGRIEKPSVFCRWNQPPSEDNKLNHVCSIIIADLPTMIPGRLRWACFYCFISIVC